MTRPSILLSNDDGIQAAPLQALAKALSDDFQVYVSAPAREQSWTGRAFSRHGEVAVAEVEGPWHAGWSVDGTPSDSVNLALGSLMSSPPDMVVSGINLGFNVTLPLIYSSGTVAAALEGAMWGLPALALSMQITRERFAEIKATNGHATGPFAEHLQQAVARSVKLVHQVLEAGTGDAPLPIVHNINFPVVLSAHTPMERTRPAVVRLGGVFEADTPGLYRFTFPRGRRVLQDPQDSDLQCLQRGHISHSLLDFTVAGERN